MEVLRQLEVVKTEALQGKKFLHYFQDIEDFVVKDSGYFMDLCFAWCVVLSVSPVGADLPWVFRAKNNAILRRKARSNSSSFFGCVCWQRSAHCYWGVHRSVV